jgi:triacylglycerol lipase
MPVDVGWLLREAPPPIDANEPFERLYAQRARQEARVLLVGGIFTDFYPGYLRRIRRALGASEIDIDSARGTLRDNAAKIRDAVLREREPVVLLGQSKGPLDIHAALALYPQIAPRVRAFVSLQAPFAGTPLAEDPRHSRVLRRLAPAAFLQMGYEHRKRFLREHSPVSPVPTVALATSTPRAGFMLEKTRRHMADCHGAINDGFVPVADAQIPGARLVRLDGLDHASLALAWLRPRAPYDAARVAQALVALALQSRT